MFLSLVGLKKLLKGAYKGGGLIVGNLEGGLVAMGASSTWGIRVEEEHIPNKLKAALIELIGDLPEAGEIYNYKPGSVQAEIDLGRFDFQGMWRQARDFAADTPFILRSKWEEYLLVQIHSTMELRAVSRKLTDMIGAKDLDHELEGMPGRPAYSQGILYWKNETMVYWAGTSVLDEGLEEKVLPNLAFLDCFEDGVMLREGGCLPYGCEEE